MARLRQSKKIMMPGRKRGRRNLQRFGENILDYEQSLFFLIARQERSEKNGPRESWPRESWWLPCHELSRGQLSRGPFFSLRSRRTTRKKGTARSLRMYGIIESFSKTLLKVLTVNALCIRTLLSAVAMILELII